jgi:hypothetical protein
VAEEQPDPPVRSPAPAQPEMPPPPPGRPEQQLVIAIAQRDAFAGQQIIYTPASAQPASRSASRSGSAIPVSEIVQAVSGAGSVLLAGLALHWSLAPTAALLVAAISGVIAIYSWRGRRGQARAWIAASALLCAAIAVALGLVLL